MKRSTGPGQLASRVSVHLLLILLLLICLYPLVWMFAISFSDGSNTSVALFIPATVSLANYQRVIVEYKFPIYLTNSVFVSAVSTVLAILFGTMSGFALARMKAPGKELLFILLLLTFMAPIQARLVPLFATMFRIGLNDTRTALMIPHVASTISVFMSRQYFLSIPKDLDESAIIDGCGWLRIYAQIIMPLAKPMISALFIVKFMGSWNDFIWPLMVLKSQQMFTLPIGLALLRNQFQLDWGLSMAGATIATLPILTVFLIFQREFVAGIAMTGVKG